MHVEILGLGAEWWVAAATGLLAIFTAGLWWATYRLSSRAEKSMRHVERAYISGGCGRTPPIFNNAGTRIGTNVGLTVQNYGKTPGYVDRVVVGSWPLDNTLPAEPDFTRGKSVFISNMLGPNSKVTTAEGASVPIDGQPKQLFYGRIDYRDIFGASHYFTFAYVFTPDTGAHEPYEHEAWWQWDGRKEVSWWRRLWQRANRETGGGIRMGVTMEATVKRGPESWAYIYVTLGFAIAIEGSIVQMWTPLLFPWNVLTFVAVSAVTAYLFLFNGWFQNKLIGLRIGYENKAR